jgi:non-ribosomal peptide synthetase component F
MEWIIGVLKSGAAYAIADQSHPLERTRGVISIAQPDLIVDNGNGRNIVELASEANIPILDPRSTDLAGLPCNNLDDISEPNDLAYIVFTSGSTGKPSAIWSIPVIDFFFQRPTERR